MKNPSRAILAIAPILLLFAEPSSALFSIASQERLGITSAWPIGVLLDGHSTLSQNQQIYLRPGGANDNVARPWFLSGVSSSSSVPDYSTVHKVLLNGVIEDMAIDAHSTDNANLPSFLSPTDGFTGAPCVSNGGYFGMVTSIGAGETGTPGGSAFNRKRTEVAGYYFENSGGIHQSYPGNDFPEFTRRQLAVSGSAAAQVKAMDFGIGFISYEDDNLPNGFFQRRGDYYFSVTSEFATTLGTLGQPLIPATGHMAHPGDVYCRRWMGSYWGPVALVLPYTLLGLSADGDLDALELDFYGGTVIFSTANSYDDQFVGTVADAERSQLMVAVLDYLGPGATLQHGGPKSLKDLNGTGTGTGLVKVTTKLGIRDDGEPTGSDEVGGACGIDPESISVPIRFGIPLAADPATLSEPKMSMSISRGRWDPSSPVGGLTNLGTMSIDVSGWGTSSPANQSVALFRREVNNPSPRPWVLVEIKQRLASQNVITFHIEDIDDSGTGVTFRNYEFYAAMRSPTGQFSRSVTTRIKMAD